MDITHENGSMEDILEYLKSDEFAEMKDLFPMDDSQSDNVEPPNASE